MPKRFHLILDASDCNPTLLEKKNLLSEVIIQIARLCQAKILLGPLLVEGSPTNPGLTALAVIDFSHISIHTFPDTGELNIDIFSCKPYDMTSVVQYIMKTFSLSEEMVKIFTIGENPKRLV